VVLSSAKLIFIFTKFKMNASATGVKELNVLKQHCYALNVSHSASYKKNLRPVLDGIMKTVPTVQKGQKICNKYRKTLQICPKVWTCSEYDMNKKEALDSFKIEQTYLFLP
jgi:hypothetical protein